jgi:hypothetical protein
MIHFGVFVSTTMMKTMKIENILQAKQRFQVYFDHVFVSSSCRQSFFRKKRNDFNIECALKG